MSSASASVFASLPSVDRLLRQRQANELVGVHGRAAVTRAIRATLAGLRAAGVPDPSAMAETVILDAVARALEKDAQSSLRPVFNLTGIVLHTNLGRALLPLEAIEAIREVGVQAASLEYHLEEGRRGERDAHVEQQLCRLTGAEAATAVNNNAAALLLVLNTLAQRKEVPASRGELIEIGGSFRLPDIMARSGCRLREVGTTNRTHLADYAEAIGPKTGLVLKVHTSNYTIEGFTASVTGADLARLCAERKVPLVVDLGSGTLVDLQRYGLPHEATVTEAVASGADLVTFSGDKLLGGPQAGLIVGRRHLVERLRRNPLKRALRLDKLTLAALSAVLRLYEDPDRLAARLPTLRLLARPHAEIHALAERLLPNMQAALGGVAKAEVIDCESQVGSGAAPNGLIASAGLAIRPANQRTAAAFRALAVPVLGRLENGALVLDLRCLEDEAGFTTQLGRLDLRR